MRKKAGSSIGMVALWLGILFFKILATSCSIRGSFQGLYSYQDKTSKIAPHLIQQPTSPICTLAQPDSAVVYLVNGADLKKCVEQQNKSLVYLWRPKCSSDICVSPGVLQSFCEKKGIELFIVAEYYDYEIMSLHHLTKRPILGIDCNYYSSHLTQKYVSRFLADILGPETTPQGNYFFLFDSGCLVSMSEDVTKLEM